MARQLTPDDPFRSVHRSKGRTAFARGLALGLALSGLVAVAFGVDGAHPAESSGAAAAILVPDAPAPPSAAAATLPQPAPLPPPASAPTLSDTGPAGWTITIDTTGYQEELDHCLWVRMDLGAPAPIVGAHNYCGGGIVLEMAVGDEVALAGTGLDGVYAVIGSRDAHAGDAVDEATAGLGADVILQSCYWHSGGRERLVALALVLPDAP